MENKINTNYIPNKNKYKVDLMHRKLFKSLQITRRENAQNKFKEWLYTNVDHDNDIVVEDALNVFSNKIVKNLKSKGFNINIKEFRDEMASLVYINSRST